MANEEPSASKPVSAPVAGTHRFDIFTLFPGMFAGPFDLSILRRAADRGLIACHIHDIREWTTDRHRSVDDTPYGGGAGMVMAAPPVVAAVEDVLGEDLASTTVIVLSAAGRLFTQEVARELATRPRVALVCGHYEGIDERVPVVLGAEEISVGDYVLTGGELAAMIIVDAVTRLVPGVIDAASIAEESHAAGLLEYPHYTRPASFRGRDVPPVLLGGHHAEIGQWRWRQALLRTAQRRLEMIAGQELTADDLAFLESHGVRLERHEQP